VTLPNWISFLQANLVLVGADNYPFFESKLIINWLSFPGSGFIYLHFHLLNLLGFLAIVSYDIEHSFNAHKHASSQGLKYFGKISVSGDFSTTYKPNQLAPTHVDVILYSFPNSKAIIQISKDSLNKNSYVQDKIKKNQVFFLFYLFIYILEFEL